MSDNVLIVLIVAATVLVILFIFRRQLSDFVFKADKRGVEARLRTHKPAAGGSPEEPVKQAKLNIVGNWQIGKRNRIHVTRPNANVSDSKQIGEDHEILVNQKDETTQ